jgi:predicted RecB family nuclease
MRANGNDVVLSATDLANFLGCAHRTGLDLAVALGHKPKPHVEEDPLLEILAQRGREHETRYVDQLRAQGLQILDLNGMDSASALTGTTKALTAGIDVIVQGALQDGQWFGRPDIILKVDKPSPSLGAWSYEIHDTKLTRETRAGTILQLGLYSHMLGQAQGETPELFKVVIPDPIAPVKEFRVDEYAAYFRLIRDSMLAAIETGHDNIVATTYPEPVDACDLCRWIVSCLQRRRKDDHLCFVANTPRMQRRELEDRDVKTLTALAHLPLPFLFKPKRGSIESYERSHHQAELQYKSRGLQIPLYDLLIPPKEGEGLCRLPEPSPGDIFLDLEGDPLAVEGGREYLFGLTTVDDSNQLHYEGFWAFDDKDERAAFERVMDLIMDAWRTHPDMHVYHYNHYEPSAFKRLMGRYATREDELDRLLRSARFIDLYYIVRQALRAGIEKYSIKNLEIFYDFTRSVKLIDANRCRHELENALELHTPHIIPQEVRDAVFGYNKDDCDSTLYLRNWLESCRNELTEKGHTVLRPELKAGDPSAEVSEKQQKVDALRARLLADIPDVDRTPEQQARWLLAYMLDYHRREDKATWFEYFRLKEMPDEDLLDESKAVSGLTFVERVSFEGYKTKTGVKSAVDRYSYPDQELELEAGDDLKSKDEKTFEIVALDRIARTMDLRKTSKTAELHPAALFEFTHIPSKAQEESLFQIGETVANAGTIDAAELTKRSVVYDMLLARAPRLRSGPFADRPDEGPTEFAVRAGIELDGSVLAIQGPPGAGKTYTGARMICELVRQGKKVGIAASSHKVIRNLMDAVIGESEKTGLKLRVGHRCDPERDPADGTTIVVHDKNEPAFDAICSGEVHVLGGTSWLWARPEFESSVDVLFLDEAGQLSLANVIAIARAGKSLVLLGDPRQLEQPRKGSHPDGVNVSGLQHLLGAHQTIPKDRGIFLPITWRLAPNICAFTSEMFYEKRLDPKMGLEMQKLGGTSSEYDGAGLWLLEVDHDGNTNSSVEEVEAVVDLVKRLTRPGVYWMNERSEQSQITGADILVVAPYNAQVSRLAERLEKRGVRVGTVDKFQGQEAPIVIYSTATSRPEDAPRGMEFLYNLNRLNVATSRARCAAILVSSPHLFRPECKSPRQMKLANALCRYREMARSVPRAASAAVEATLPSVLEARGLEAR